MMEIKILGMGCVDCELMRDLVFTALDALVVRNYRIEVIMDPQELSVWLKGVSSPGLLLNDKLVLAGSVPSLEDVIVQFESEMKK